MDDKHDKKKESIDEILSDLNGLLNKMPSILDGIKMSEMQPAEFSPARTPEPRAPQPEARNNIPVGPQLGSAPPGDADKTVVLESFSGLSDGSQVPGETHSFQAPEPASPQPEPALPQLESASPQFESALPQLESASPQFESASPQFESASPQFESASPGEADKTVVLESLSGLQGVAASPEQGEPVPQSLGDFMFGVEAEEKPEKSAAAAPIRLSGTPLEPPPEKPARNTVRGPSLSVSEFTPPAPEEASAPAYANTRDFGVPDIDVLMRMSEGGDPGAEPPPQSLPGAGLIPGWSEATQLNEQVVANMSAQFVEEQKDGPPFPAAADFEPQLPAAAPEGDAMKTWEPEDGKNEIPQPEAALPAPESEGLIIEPEAKPETSFGIFPAGPSYPEPVPAQDGGETLRLEPVPESIGAIPDPRPVEPAGVPGAFSGTAAEPGEVRPGVEIGAEPAAEPEIETNRGIQGPGAEPATGPATGIEFGGGAPAQSVSPGETLPGGPGLELSGPAPQSLSGDGSGSVQNGTGQYSSSSMPLSGDETLVIAPSPAVSGEEEKTVIFQAGPATTSRAQAGDLSALSARQTPEGIPAERVRTLAFLYSPGDEALCATVLAELDAICLKSASKPMFIKRAYVKGCDSDSNAGFIYQSVVDTGAAGLVCLGAIPQEKVYETENMFSTSGGFFRYYDSSSFSHSAALDLVTDLIVR